MESKYGEFVGVDNLFYSIISADSDSEYTPGGPVYLAPVAEIGGAPEINNSTTYYDNKAANNFVTEGKTELKVVVSNVPAALMAILLGKYYDESSGRVYDSGEPAPPDIALGFRYNMGKSGYRYYWYLKGTFSGGTEEATTKKENVEIKTYTLTFTAVTSTYKFTIGSSEVSVKRVFGDTEDEAFDPTDWFTQVQTPEVAGAPTAIALSSIVPNDEDVDVDITDSIVLIFNNAIENEAISIIKSDGTIVAGTKTWDSTYKILTFDPTSSLDTNSTYIVAINGVVDIYGQELAGVATNFTTAA